MRILFADDSEDTRVLTTSLLKKRGYTVEVFTDGDELLERLASGSRPDVVITDNRMTRVDGMEVLRRLRSDSRFAAVKDLPVIIHSSAVSREAKRTIDEFNGRLVFKELRQFLSLLAALDAIEKGRE